eukprot:CAMPEP_0194395018 /NCGR_PEP_ID=MMETSP0174-20130528/124183_1 /TAXON_ID=216777 /ORGANISM="Proboscia alata, Strain PI-D3" /LENGTH=807 /DNA_ID=CAMNT_0039190895 /DNA_START=125 /DNA_END=2548 /DNA_ORIENTATION=-
MNTHPNHQFNYVSYQRKESSQNAVARLHPSTLVHRILKNKHSRNDSGVGAVDRNAVTSSNLSSTLEKHSRTNPSMKHFLCFVVICICCINNIVFARKKIVDGSMKASNHMSETPNLENRFNPFSNDNNATNIGSRDYTGTTGDYKLYVRTPKHVTLDDLAHCFQQRHNGSTIFQDDGKKILSVGNKESLRRSKYLANYMPEVLADVYLWRASRRWGGLTTRLEDADVVLLLSFPVISKYAGKCNGTTHVDRQSSVINWARKNLNNTTPAAFVCPSWALCDGAKTRDMLKRKNIRVLMKERNPKWLMPKFVGAKFDTPPFLTEWVNDRKRAFMIPYPANRNIGRLHPRLLEIPDNVPYDNSNENNRSTTSRTTLARSKTGVLFIGSLRGVKVRTVMSRIANREDTKIVTTNFEAGKIGGIRSVKSYAQQMMAALFCLCPSGDTPTARRLYDSIVAGCLPIVISDTIIQHVPFPETIDYESFWFRIKKKEWIRNPGAELDRVLATPVEEIARRQNQMASYVSALDNNTTPAAFVCPSWALCDGAKTRDMLKRKNIRVLMKERNPKWLMPGYYGKDEFPQILDKWVKNTTRTRIIPYPANRNIERFHPRLLEIQDDVQYNNSNENVRITTSRTTPARSKTGVLFIGSLRGVEVRTIMSQIAHRNDTQIVTTNLGGQEGEIKSVKSYAQQMMAAQFCLCPSGDSPTARRLYDAIVAGCLPIVISDDIIRHVPFPQTIDYESFWFRIKEAEWISDPGAELDRVVATPVENIARRQNLMASYVSALDWTDSNNNDGLRLILDEIVMAGQRRPR